MTYGLFLADRGRPLLRETSVAPQRPYCHRRRFCGAHSAPPCICWRRQEFTAA